MKQFGQLAETKTTEKTRKPIPWFSGILATLFALLIVAIALPDTDRVVIDHSGSQPRLHVQPDPFAVCGILVLTFLPVLCIFVLGRRWSFFNWLGAILMLYLLLGVLVK